MFDKVLSAFGLNGKFSATSLGNGLIHKTWKVVHPSGAFILQRVNDFVFKDPGVIASNISLLASYLHAQYPEYLFVSTLPDEKGNHVVFIENEGWFRLFPFISDSHSLERVKTSTEAFEAARQFAELTYVLRDFPVERLEPVIPGFHDLELRTRQYRHAVINAETARRERAAATLQWVDRYAFIPAIYARIRSEGLILNRVTHHDTKISNVLFRTDSKALCVVDLDTIGPGYFISDLGDMMRTYLSPAGEEERDFHKIVVREEVFEAVVEGYLSGIRDGLADGEKRFVYYSGMFMIYMQAIRFITDYLNGDVYYGSLYEGHSLVRGENQLTLLDQYVELSGQLTGRIRGLPPQIRE